MNTALRFALLAFLSLACGLPALADQRAFSASAKSGSDEDRAEAEHAATRKAVEIILKEEGLEGRILGKAREALITECTKLLTKPRFKERRGKWRYSAKLELDRVREKVIAAKGGEASAKKVKLVAAILVGGKAPAEAVHFAVSEVFRKSGYTLLEGDPKQAPKEALVVTIKIGLKFEASRPNSAEAGMFEGRYRMMGSVYQVFDRATKTVRLRGQLRSDRSRRELEESTAKALVEPRVAKGDSRSAVEEDYTVHAAQWAARLIVQKLNASPVAPGGAASARYTLRLKGFSATQIKDLHKVLKALKVVKNFKDIGKLKVFDIARLEITGDGVAVVKAALKKAGLEGKLSKAGTNLTVIKKK